MPARVAVVYYSSTGHVHQLATAVAEGAEGAGAEVRVRRVPELAPEEVIRSQDAWHEHHVATKDTVPEAKPEDLEWANAMAFGTPTRFGLPAAQLKQFIDTTGGLWAQGLLADKVYAALTSTGTDHGGQEATLLALANTFYHWGGFLVPPGYTDPMLYASGGNPYGTSYVTGQDIAKHLPDTTVASARYQGARLARFAQRLAAED